MRRGVVAPVVVVAAAVLTGGWLLQRGVDRAENVYLKVHLLQEVVDRVESSYVDKVDPGSLYHSAIDGLIDDLHDPYSSFMEASDFENLRIQGIEGEYGGVGLEVIERDDYVTVVSPMPGTPGARAGIRGGDQFFEIEGQPADTMNVDQAVALLRGKPGSSVQVKMLRPGIDDPIPFTLTREVIQLKAVPFALMLEPGIGYVPLQSVLESSSAEMRSALDSLRTAGMKSVVVDLRGNPGGLLDQGIEVSDLFLDKGRSIVETRGRAQDQNATYKANLDDRYAGLSMIVLVDGGSASASEIIAGALQDNDRALLVGASTFGKGLVQSLYRLSGGNVLRLTTARWYTPVGRSINKDPDARFHPEGGGSLSLSGQFVAGPDLSGRPTYESVGGRRLYGGGGIAPDVFVMPDVLNADEERAVRALYRQNGTMSVAVFNYAVRYVQDHPDLKPGFDLTAADLDSFYRRLPEWDVSVDRADFRAAHRFISYQLEREIALQAWGDEGQFLQERRFDKPLAKAVELLQGAPSQDELLARVTASAEASAGS
jgi:carboxyl-terminal processing protease